MGHMVCWKLLDSFDGFGLLNSKLVNEQNAKITSMHTHTHFILGPGFVHIGKQRCFPLQLPMPERSCDG